jgi:hypothetical protein
MHRNRPYEGSKGQYGSVMGSTGEVRGSMGLCDSKFIQEIVMFYREPHYTKLFLANIKRNLNSLKK